jgi:DNA-binding cell septation regulator SpoVG
MQVSIDRQNVVNKGSLIAFVDVVLNDQLIIKGCKIMQSNGGKWVGMPSQKNEKDGKYYDHCRFKDRATQDEFSHLVISAFEGNSGAGRQSDAPKQQERDKSPAEIAWEE